MEATTEVSQTVESATENTVATIARGEGCHSRPTNAFHPACLAFPQMPDEDLQALAADIKTSGQQAKIIRWHGQIIDGRNRLLACGIAGVEPKFKDVDKDLKDDAAVWQSVYSLNLHRRHLSREDRARLIEERLKATPEASNRQIAKQTGTNHETVQAHREKLEATGGIRQLQKTVGADGKHRKKRINYAKAALNWLKKLKIDSGQSNWGRARSVLQMGIPPLKKAVEAGTITLSEAATIANQSEKLQEKAVETATAAPVTHAAEMPLFPEVAEPMPAEAEVNDAPQVRVCLEEHDLITRFKNFVDAVRSWSRKRGMHASTRAALREEAGKLAVILHEQGEPKPCS